MNVLVTPNGLNDVIHAAGNAVFSGFVYTQIYAQASATPTVNGTAVTLPAGMSLPILVKSCSATADVFLIGKAKVLQSQYING